MIIFSAFLLIYKIYYLHILSQIGHPRRRKMKTLIMLSAIPASGKSTWAKEYQQNNPNTYIVNSDDIRMEVTHGDYHDHTKQKQVWELFEKRRRSI